MVTIDAIGCQAEIAAQIVGAGADYCLAVKGNQTRLHEGLRRHFEKHLGNGFAETPLRQMETEEKAHGREEKRFDYICPVPADLPDRQRWASLKAIRVVINQVTCDGRKRNEVRYYILSRYVAAKRFADTVRGHWGVDNSLHLQLDVTFQEDRSRVRKGHADANFSILRRSALSLLKNEPTGKVGVKNKRLMAGWDDEYLLNALLGP